MAHQRVPRRVRRRARADTPHTRETEDSARPSTQPAEREQSDQVERLRSDVELPQRIYTGRPGRPANPAANLDRLLEALMEPVGRRLADALRTLFVLVPS